MRAKLLHWAAVPAETIRELAEFIAIPSVSPDPARAEDVLRAADWVVDRIRAAGGEGDRIDWHGQPLVVGEIPASRDPQSAPTVLCYGHVDVQPPEPLDLWETDPFVLTEKDEWLYARGVADDKAQLYMLLRAASDLALAGELPVNVRFACDGEEELGGHSIVEWLEQDERGADAGVVFDSSMLARGVPAFNVACRGLTYFEVKVRTGERDLHSGMYGAAALNACNVLAQILGDVLPTDGVLPEALRKGIVPPSEAELASWAHLEPGAEMLAAQGARPSDPRAAEEFYLRVWAQPSFDVNGLYGGTTFLGKTVLPVEAGAYVSTRLAPGQSVPEIDVEFRKLLEGVAPEGAEVEVTLGPSIVPGLVDGNAPAVQLALDAFEKTIGTRPLLVRSGGSIAMVPALSSRGIPVVVTGFDLPEGNIHSPNERLLKDYLPLGIETAKELFRSWAAL
jgi:acetylornithine deacetylase/succinyl-diaminopimelate desuccinylase-like protein